MPDPDDLEAVRAEGRRLLAAAGRGGHSELADLECFMVDNAPALLVDPAPAPVPAIKRSVAYTSSDARLPAPAPEGVPEDRLVPDGWRVEWVPFLCGWCTTGHDLGTFPRLVPDTPHEEGAEQ